MKINVYEAYKLVRFDLPVSSEGIDIWLVDGNAVRDTREIDFIGGGHHFVYGFIPENEIWIDIDTGDADIVFYIVHELTERPLMRDGMDYVSAHEQANVMEHKEIGRAHV